MFNFFPWAIWFIALQITQMYKEWGLQIDLWNVFVMLLQWLWVPIQ